MSLDNLFENSHKDLNENYKGDLSNLPNELNHDLSCRNNKYESLENCPLIINGNFDCSHNRLKSLKGAPLITKIFIASNNSLKELDISTEEIDGNFYCENNSLLTKLNGKLKVINGDVFFSNCYSLTIEEIKKFKQRVKISGKIYDQNKEEVIFE